MPFKLPQIPRQHHDIESRVADDIEFDIVGEDLQFVEIELDPGESAVAEAGAMMHKHPAIELTTVFGDGKNQDGSFMGKLIGAGKRVLTGESLFMTVFTHQGEGKATVAFAAPYPGRIVPMKLDELDGVLIAQKDCFLAAAKGVEVGIHFQKKILTGLFGGEGFVMQKLSGDGWVFVHAGGVVQEKVLGPGEGLHVDTGCVMAHTEGGTMDVGPAGSIRSMIFGGEGAFLAQLTGPGRVWVQSLPLTRLAGRLRVPRALGEGG